MDTWDHLKHLKSIVEAHTKAGIKIQPKKTKIFQTETEYLLGFTGYYRGFIPKYLALTNRMNSLKKVEKFVWTEDMEKDFLELKAEFSAGWIQAYPDFDSDEPFILTKDCRSSLNIAGVLSQKQESRTFPGLLGAEM